MPTAICNTCNELVPYKNKAGHYLKDEQCVCGSSNLSVVSGRWNEPKHGWDYYDRSGNFKKFVSQGTPKFETTEIKQ